MASSSSCPDSSSVGRRGFAGCGSLVDEGLTAMCERHCSNGILGIVSVAPFRAWTCDCPTGQNAQEANPDWLSVTETEKEV